ncbi:MAG: sigma-54-dependent Fis family transcriptional regulator, partial [bacterium]|nr:sigma-54-dependent Fis family transcriptional regulator [bacterium]
GRDIAGFSQEARALFLAYPWPGNVRELQNTIERAVVLSSDRTLGPEHFNLSGDQPARTDDGDGVRVPMGTTVSEMEKELILKTLSHCGENRTHAARVLGISVRTLRNKLKDYFG